MHLSKSELKYLRSLSQKKFRDAERKFLLEGWRAVKDALNSTFKIELAAILPRYVENPDYETILHQLETRRVAVKEVTELELKQISDTVHSQGIVALVHQRRHDIRAIFDGKSNLIVAADSIADPGNIGSILRTCDWFGVDAVLLGKGSVELYNEKVVRSTAGSIFHMPVVEDVDLAETLPKLRTNGFYIAATAGDGMSGYGSIEAMEKTAIVFGSEAKGISREVREAANTIARIPKFGQAESLNVGVVCGIILAHIKSNQNPKS